MALARNALTPEIIEAYMINKSSGKSIAQPSVMLSVREIALDSRLSLCTGGLFDVSGTEPKVFAGMILFLCPSMCLPSIKLNYEWRVWCLPLLRPCVLCLYHVRSFNDSVLSRNKRLTQPM